MLDKLGSHYISKFWSHVKHTKHCWEWLGAKNTDGYGYTRVYKNGEVILFTASHRMAYQLWNETWLDKDVVVRHTCDNRLCVNPNHLIAGTQKDNVMDAIERGRNFKKLNDVVVKEILELRKKGLKQKDIAKMYGVSQSLISGIERGKFRHNQ